jgi:hypothetical protein
MLLLYKGGINSELCVVCYSGMARTHFLKLERLQYRGLRIALGSMQSMPNSFSFGGKMYVYLNYRYLVTLCRNGLKP